MTRMELLRICDPIFAYVCRLNRSGRKGVELQPAVVRADVKQLFSEARSRASGDVRLKENWEKVELPLIYFVDSMIQSSGLSMAGEWQELAHERNKMAGDEEFFDHLDADLKDQSDAATERLVVYYTCLGLGFTGFYAGQPEYLRRKMMEMSARIRPYMDSDKQSRICPEAYEQTDTSDLIQPPGAKLVGLAIVLVVATIAVLVGNAYFYHTASQDLRNALDRIVGRVTETAPAPTDG